MRKRGGSLGVGRVAAARRVQAGDEPPEDPEPALEWLLEFVGRDLSLLKPGERSDLALDVMLFSGDKRQGRFEIGPLHSRRGEPPVSTNSFDRSPEDFPDDDEQPRMRSSGRSLPLETLARLQTSIKDGLNELAAGAVWKLPAPPRAWFLEVRGGRLCMGYEGRAEGCFLARVAELLTEHWPRLGRCSREGCGVWFGRYKGQEYCSPRCSGMVRQERFRMKHPRRRRDYPAEHQRRVRKRLGPKVRTKRQAHRGGD